MTKYSTHARVYTDCRPKSADIVDNIFRPLFCPYTYVNACLSKFVAHFAPADKIPGYTTVYKYIGLYSDIRRRVSKYTIFSALLIQVIEVKYAMIAL